MCLGTELSTLGQKRIINKAKKQGYIRVWKAVILKPTYFEYWLQVGRYKKGIRKAGQLCKQEGGWHAFRDKKSAERYCTLTDIVIECLALPEWIKNSGKCSSLQTILFTKLCFPKFPERKVTVKEFKQLCKAVK